MPPIANMPDGHKHPKPDEPGYQDYILEVQTIAASPKDVLGAGRLPISRKTFLAPETGTADIFTESMATAMGWSGTGQLTGRAKKQDRDFLIISTQGGIRGDDGEAIALGAHTGHWELGLVAVEAAREFARLGKIPFYLPVADICDGRWQGEPEMQHSLPYRNDAAIVMRRLIESVPTRKGVMGISSCDKGVPATLMALAGKHDLPAIFIPGGVALPTRMEAASVQAAHVPVTLKEGRSDARVGQALKPLLANREITTAQAQEIACTSCGVGGGGCQFLGTAATSQVVAEALGMSLPHSALTPSGQPIWLDLGRRSAEALVNLRRNKLTTRDILTDDAIYHAMVVHAAFGGSSNLLMHIPAIAYEAGLRLPKRGDWEKINRTVPRLVDIMPNGDHSTVTAFMAGGVPEVMLHLRDLGLLKLGVMTVTGRTLGENLKTWEKSERRARLRRTLKERDGIDPDTVIYSPEKAKARGLTGTLTFPEGNLMPEGSVIKSTAIAASVVGTDPVDPAKPGQPGIYHKIGPARVFSSEVEAMKAINAPDGDPNKIKPGDIMVLAGYGPLGMGMPETFQITNALKMVSWGKHVALLTDGRFSGVSSGACIGHIGPEARAGGPIGKVREGDIIEIIIDTNGLTGSVNLIGDAATPKTRRSPEKGAQILAARRIPAHLLGPNPELHPDVQLWAAMQNGAWNGCINDRNDLIKRLRQASRR
jgi:putative YjhG/YagF family dehydratase